MLNLKSKAESGVRWTAINSFCITIFQFIQLSILGRILTPEDYGLMAFVLLFDGFAMIFADIGLSSAIIQRKVISNEELSSLYWLNVLSGFILYGIIFLLTPLFAKITNCPQINILLPVASTSFLISSFGTQFGTLMKKELLFNVTSKINIISLFLSILVSICCAISGFGVWSLVLGRISNTIFGTILLFYCGCKRYMLPSIYFRLSDTKSYLSFGFYRVCAMSINYLNSNIDQLLIGMFLGPVSLGFYNVASRFVLQPIQKINPILTSIAFPLFSKIQDDHVRLKNAFMKMTRLLMSVNAPILIGFSVVAPVAVPLIIGDKWHPSIPLIQVLSFYALIRSLGNAGGSLILSKGKANWTLYWNILLLLLIPPLIFFVSQQGQAVYIAFALLVLQIILFLFHYYFFIRKLLGPVFIDYIKIIGRPILLSCFMVLPVIAISFFEMNFSPPILLFLQIFTGVLSYYILAYCFQRELLIDIKSVIWAPSKKL